VPKPSIVPAPIVPITAALVLGAAWGGARPAPEAAGLAACAAIASAYVSRRKGGLATVFAAAAALALGAALQGVVWRAAGGRLAATFSGERIRQVDTGARVLAAAERDREGGRSLTLLTEASAANPSLTVRFSILNVPDDDAAKIDGLRRGDVVHLFGRLRAPADGPGSTEADARRRLAAERLDATGGVKSSRLVTMIAPGPWTMGRALDDGRVRARRALDRAVGSSGEARAVLGAMLLGDRLLLDEDTNLLLRDAGLVHILSISGLHTAMSVLLVLALLRRSGLGARGLLFAGGASLLAFSTFVGHGASVWRACAGLAVGLVARVLGREVDALSALALAAATLVAAVPPLAWSQGFLLSVIATAGLIVAAPQKRADGSAPSLVKRSLAATSGAYLATAPLLAASFTRLAPAALAANLLAAPLCAFCLSAGAAAILFSAIPYAGPIAAVAAKASVTALLAVSRWASEIPGGHFRVAPPTPLLALLYVVLLLVAIFGRELLRPHWARTVRLLLAFCLIALHLGPPPPGRGPVALTVLDVGQGLSVAVRGPDGRFLLADAGPSGGGRFDAGDRIVIPALVAQGCRRLEVFALSHDHDDHAGGGRAVLRDLDVGELWVGEGSERDPLTRRVMADAVARGVAVRRLKRGERDERAGLDVAVLHPGPGDFARSLNDRCLVVRVRAPDLPAILLPGDLEAGGEAALLASGADPSAGVLVAPHHGANGSSTRAFLARVAPQFVLVSAGEGNRFGHPGAAALSRFADVDAKVLRTDRNGSISLTEVAGRWRASVEKNRLGDERQDEDDGESDRHDDPPASQRLGFVDQAGMTVAEHEEDQEPEAVRRGRSRGDGLHGDEGNESADGGERADAVHSGRNREHGVAAVQLPDRKQIHRGDEHPHPRRAVDRADLELGAPVKIAFEDPRAKRWAERKPVQFLRRGKLGRLRDPQDQQRQRDDEARDRTRSRDVEQRPP
jgi:competence protein ComEC